MTIDRWLCGWRVASEIPLPDLMPWQDDDRQEDDRTADIVVRIGDVPERLTDPVHEGPLLQVAADGTCRYNIPGIAAYLVQDGRRIIVKPEMDASAPDVRLFLLGSVFGFLCHQRGLLPLHAGCVEIGGRAVAFAGQSGAGKSTLTAAFARRGHPVLADDVTVVDVAAPGGPCVLPSFPRLKLWRATIDRLGLTTEGLERSRTGLEKFNLPIAAGFPKAPMPLDTIYILETVTDRRREGTQAQRGLNLVAELFSVVYRRTMAFNAGRQAALMQAVAALANIPVQKLSRMHDLSALDKTMDVIVACARPASDSGAA